MKTPLSIYEEKLAAGEIRPDINQRPIIEKLDTLFQTLVIQYSQKKSWLRKLKRHIPVKGLYLWGNVGIGKTFMMDCFYDALPIKKMRLHFHQFMRQIHEDLTEIQGQINPLDAIAKKIAQTARVICFDEFLVSNIADAMILGELFRALFTQGITLITSSNTPPDLLYKEGLQRERFLPAIALIKAHTEVILLHTQTDYRKQHIQQAGVYYCPEDLASEKHMQNCFTHFSRGSAASDAPITLYNRDIPIIKRAANVIWFDFEVICGRPRSQNDYLEIAKQYHTILINGLRQIKPREKDLILSFIYLVDILYNAHCRLVISASTSLENIYTEQATMGITFARTLSRLIEMQSENYVYPGSLGNDLTVL